MSVLQGIRVLDVGSWIAAPAAATIMSDFGASVIKVEPPGRGDPYRALARRPGMPQSEVDYCWLLDARNKRSLALDLSVPEAREVLYALVERADVFLTNLQPSALARLRLTWEELAARNPRLVYASLTGYGDTGEEADKPGFDSNAWWARSGLMELMRPTGGMPPGSVPGMGDHPTALAMFGAIMMALYQRERTGQGSKVSSSLMANGAWANACYIQAALCGATFVERRPRDQARNALANIYQCRDGRWFMLSLLSEEREWPQLCEAVGRHDLARDPRFATAAARLANSVALVGVLDALFATRDWADWQIALRTQDITFGVVARLGDLARDAQMAATGTLVPFEDAGIPGLRTVMSPIQMTGVEKTRPRRAPSVGEHTDEILGALGYDAAAIARLRARRAIG